MATEPQATAEDSAVAVPEEVVDLKLLDPILDEFKGQKGAVIPILQRAPGGLRILAPAGHGLPFKDRLPAQPALWRATFYAQFRLTRRGRHLIRCCDGTACHVRGAAKAIETLEDAISLEAGSTSPDYKYTMEIVYCLGSCGLAPVAVIDDKVHGRLTPDALVAQVATLQ